MGAIGLLPWALMTTNRALRQHVRALVKHGVSQKMLAAEMGLSETKFSRWLNGEEGAKAKPLDVDAMDRLREFERKLANLLKQGGPPSQAGATFPEPEGQEPQIQTGERKR